MRKLTGVLLSASTLLAFPIRGGSLVASSRYARNSEPLPTTSVALPLSLRRKRELGNFIDKLQAILLIDPDAIYQFSALADGAIEELEANGQWHRDDEEDLA